MSLNMDEVRAQIRNLPAYLPSPSEAKAIRRAAHVSQQQMAEWVGVQRVAIYRWEAGIRTPRARYRGRYAEILLALRDIVEDGGQ